MTTEMLEKFETARRHCVPITVVRTADQFATAKALCENSTRIAKELKIPAGEYPFVQWDKARGITAYNEAGVAAMDAANIPDGSGLEFDDAMVAAMRLPRLTVLLVHNAHRQLVSAEPKESAANVQAVANMRDYFQADFRMLVLLCPDITLPPELQHDVLPLEDPLPGPEELEAVVRAVHKNPTAPPLNEDDLPHAVEALSGLSNFEAKQVTSMALTPERMSVPAIRRHKIITINQIPGLTVWTGPERFSDVVGQEAIKAKLTHRIRGLKRLGVVVWIDEIDKALANVEHDTSGTRMYQLLKLLTEMENNEWTGFVAVGAAGAGKSLIGKALGNEADVLTMALDLGATESKYVGDSEANMNRVIATIKAVGRGEAYFVATSNAATIMRPELQRRFTDGVWMFDLMTKEERAAAWVFFMAKYGLPDQTLPADEGWTGAEIRNCCRDARDLRISLLEAALTILPMSQSRQKELDLLREFATGRFLDANKGGKYVFAKPSRAVGMPQPRGLALSAQEAALFGNTVES